MPRALLFSSLLLGGCLGEPAAAATVRVDATGDVRAQARTVESTWIRAHDRRVARREVTAVGAEAWPLEWIVDAELLGARRFYVVLRALDGDAPEAAVVSRQLLLAELREGEHVDIDVVLVDTTSAPEDVP